MKRAIASASVLAAVLALSACGGGGGASSQTTETTTETTQASTTSGTTTQTQATKMTIVVVGGVPKGGITRATVHQGDRVVVAVTSDVSDEVHVHGYDLKANVAPGKPARISFVANIPGRFDIELESRSLQIGDLTVQ
jgi:hypothetical protein